MPRTLLALGLASALLLDVPPTPARADEPDPPGAVMPDLLFALTWGQQGTSESLGRYDTPQGIATYTDPYGETTLVVSDSGNHRIKHLSNVGGFNVQFGREGPGEGDYRMPGGVVADRRGALYVADTGNDRVKRVRLWTPSQLVLAGTCERVLGESGSAPGQFRSPSGVALDESGNLYVLDSGNNRVQKFSPAGDFLATWGRGGSGPGEMADPVGIAIGRDGGVYVTDTGNHRVLKFDPEGRLLASWGAEGDEPGQLREPTGIAVMPGGVVAVASTGNHRIEFFDEEGRHLGRLGRAGTRGGEFLSPHGVASDAKGNLYVTEVGTHRIQKFRNPSTRRP